MHYYVVLVLAISVYTHGSFVYTIIATLADRPDISSELRRKRQACGSRSVWHQCYNQTEEKLCLPS